MKYDINEITEAANLTAKLYDAKATVESDGDTVTATFERNGHRVRTWWSESEPVYMTFLGNQFRCESACKLLGATSK